jgi:hypothetical protein
MSEAKIRRSSKAADATVGTSTAVASAIDCRGMAGGIVAFPAGISTAVTAMAMYASDAQQGPFYELRDRDGVAVSITLSTSTAAAYAMPFEVANADWLTFITSSTPGTANVARVTLKG